MSPTEGKPALSRTDGGPNGEITDPRPRRRPGRKGLRAVLAVARIEAWLLVRSPLLVIGLLGGAALFWQFVAGHQPLWWVVSWQVGHGQVLLSTTVLLAGHLAAGRVRRNGLTALYESFPASATTRSGGQLAGLVGSLPASLLLIAFGFAVAQLRAPIGNPDTATLAAGVLLVIAAGAIGVALGARLSHPLAGVVAALVWLLLYGQSNQFNGTSVWLFPWLRPGQLEDLPHPVTGYPPGAGHALELAGIAALAAAVALLAVAGDAKARLGASLVAVVAAAGIYRGAAVQLRPVPTSALDQLVAETANPASAQQCARTNDVRYCLYPGFGALLPTLRGPVEAVLARLPSRPPGTLVVRQASMIYAGDSSLTAGHTARQIAGWATQLAAAPEYAQTTGAIYVPVGDWPAGGGLAAARFDLALDTAVWAVGLPPSIAAEVNPSGPTTAPPCVALDQAREAVAIYLAVQATHASTPPPAGGRHSVRVFVINGAAVPGWQYPGGNASIYAIPSGLALSDQGYLLARAMTQLPAATVAQVLRSGWTTWRDWRTTDAQLAAALGISAPSAPPGPPLVAPPPGANPPPQSPVCR